MNEPAAAPGQAPALVATELHKRFREGRGAGAIDVTVLRGLSLHVERGETLAIVGATALGEALVERGGFQHQVGDGLTHSAAPPPG